MILWRGGRLCATSPMCYCKYLTAALAASATISFALPLTLRGDTTRSVTSHPVLPSRASRLMFRRELRNRPSSSSVGSSGHHESGAGKEIIYETEEKGVLYTLDYRMFFKGPKGYISPWHDIPLRPSDDNTIYNMVVEIPRWSNAKMEISTKEAMTPIRQDIKKGLPRFTANVFPHHGYIWNYGALPQTWEDPGHLDPETNTRGDNDPIDVIEIGSKIHKRGSVIQVKALGVIALIDEGETDWKVIALDITDPMANEVVGLDDVETHFPGLLKATLEWFRTYKIPMGKPPNEFGYNGEAQDAKLANEVINQCHNHWKKLFEMKDAELNIESSMKGAAFPSSQESWKKLVDSLPVAGPADDPPSHLDQWYFIKKTGS